MFFIFSSIQSPVCHFIFRSSDRFSVRRCLATIHALQTTDRQTQHCSISATVIECDREIDRHQQTNERTQRRTLYAEETEMQSSCIRHRNHYKIVYGSKLVSVKCVQSVMQLGRSSDSRKRSEIANNEQSH